MLLFVLMALFAKIPHRLKTLLKAVLCIAAVSLALLLINAYHYKPVGILKYVTAEIQRHGVAYHVDKPHAMTACGDNTFISPSGCLPCPNGTFSFPGWTECKPFLDCSEIARQVHLKQPNAFRGVTKKKWMAEWEGHEVVYMKCACKRCQERCLRGMTRMEMFQGPFVTSLIGRCYDKLEIVTMYYKHGSTKYLNGYLKKEPGVSQYNNLKTRFQLVVDYVKVMNYLHNSPVGAIVMCDTANIVKALSQYLITDDFHLVVNDLDNTPLVADTDGILCSHKRAKESNSWFSPEQRGLSDSDSVPKTDEKIEIWRIPAVMKKLLDGVEGSGFVQSKLDKVMTRCQATNPQQRPTANEVVQELLRVQQLIT